MAADVADTPPLPESLAVPHRRTAERPGPDQAAGPIQHETVVWQPMPFEPSSRRLRRHRVLGARAPRNVQSAFGRLRTQFIQRLQQNGWNTVAVTSPTRGAGTTLTAINLAVSIARDYDYNVVLVELDFANPSFRRVFGFGERRGLVDYLLRNVPIGEIVLSPGVERLHIVPAGPRGNHSTALLSSARMSRFIDEMRMRNERCLVLFDLPCLLATDHATVFAPLVDCALLVVEEGQTRVNEVRYAADLLRGTNLLGVAVNQSDQLNRNGDVILP